MKEDNLDGIRKKNPNFNKEIFERKVSSHMVCGYTKELAEWKVLNDFNSNFFGFFGIKPNKKKTDIEGYFI